MSFLGDRHGSATRLKPPNAEAAPTYQNTDLRGGPGPHGTGALEPLGNLGLLGKVGVASGQY